MGGGALHRLAAVTVVLAVLVVPAGASAASSPPLVGFVSSSTALSGTTAVAVSGSYAYTTAYYAGELTAVNISNPVAPVIAGSTPSVASLENGSTVNISGNYAFVASKNRNASTSSNDDGTTGNSLTVVNISNPASPTIVGSVHDSSRLFGAYGIAVSGHYAFVASQGLLSGQPTAPDKSAGSFSVIDLNNLSAGVVANIDNASLPAPWAGKNLLQHATAVAISGNYAYVTAFYSARLTIFNISNPLAPTIVTSIADWTHLAYNADVALQGNYAYVADQTSGSGVQFAVVNVSNPAKPSVVGSLSSSLLAGAYRVRVRGSFAYLAGSSVATIAAIDISNPARPRIAGSVTDSTHLYHTTGLDLDPSGRYVIASSPGVGATYPPYPLQPGGATDTGTISAIDLIPSPIGVTITPASEPANPTTQASASFVFAVNDPVSTVQCGLDGAPLAPCTTPTTQQYTSLGTGSHTFAVQAADAAGNTATSSYTWLVTAPPQNTSAPAISGSATAGSQLTASSGSWSGYPAPSFSYQWERCDQNGQSCNAISTATSSTYTVQAADVGSTLELGVTATNSAGSASASSQATATVQPSGAAPVNTAAPGLSGTAVEAQTLSVTNGTWSGYPSPSLTYEWQRCDQSGQNCAAIPGATSQSYTLLSADVGSTVNAVVTGTNASGSVPAASATTTVVTSAPGPLTPLLDNFNRPNNSGPPSASWTHMVVSSTGSSNNLLITSNQVTGTSGSNADYWNPQAYGPNSEVWITVAQKPTVDQDPVVLGLRFQNPGASTAGGYQAYYIYRSSGQDQYRIVARVNGTTSTTLASVTGPKLNPGDQLLFRAIGTTLELWRASSGTWTRILTATDSTFTSAGYLNLTTRDTTVRLDNFGGGALP